MGPTVRTDNLYRSDHQNATPPPGSSATDVTMADMSTDVAPNVAAPLSPVSAASTSGWRTSVVFFVIFIPTVAVGFVDMYVHRSFTYWTGAVFILACLVAALRVRPLDLWTAVIIPPMAYLLALICAGQPSTFPGGGNLMIREVSLIATGLAFNAPYIYGGTLVALIVVLIRRRSIRKG